MMSAVTACAAGMGGTQVNAVAQVNATSADIADRIMKSCPRNVGVEPLHLRMAGLDANHL
jgi:hypothetical protein